MKSGNIWFTNCLNGNIDNKGTLLEQTTKVIATKTSLNVTKGLNEQKKLLCTCTVNL